MSHRGAITEPSSTAVQEHDRGPHAALRLLGVPTFVGSYLASASDSRFSFAGMFNTLLRTLLVVTGTGPLNQYLEPKFDAHMRRTARSPRVFSRPPQFWLSERHWPWLVASIS